MLFVPVDLFTPWIEGREYAIDRNWNDLNQAEKVTGARLDNNASRLRNWFAQDTYGDRIAANRANTNMTLDRAFVSGLDTDVAAVGQQGRMSQAQFGSDYQTALADNLRRDIPNLSGAQADIYRNTRRVDLARSNAANQYAAQTYDARANVAAQQAQAQAQLLPAQTQAAQAALGAQTAQQQAIAAAYAAPPQVMSNPWVPQLPGSPQAVVPAGAPVPQMVQPAVQPAAAPVGSNPMPDFTTLRNVLGRAQPGAEHELTMPDGSRVTGGRDAVGLYFYYNGQKVYLPEATYTDAPLNDGLNWMGGD